MLRKLAAQETDEGSWREALAVGPRSSEEPSFHYVFRLQLRMTRRDLTASVLTTTQKALCCWSQPTLPEEPENAPLNGLVLICSEFFAQNKSRSIFSDHAAPSKRCCVGCVVVFLQSRPVTLCWRWWSSRNGTTSSGCMFSLRVLLHGFSLGSPGSVGSPAPAHSPSTSMRTPCVPNKVATGLGCPSGLFLVTARGRRSRPPRPSGRSGNKKRVGGKRSVYL